VSSRETHRRWKLLAHGAIAKSAQSAEQGAQREERFTVDGKGPVCVRFWSAAYGITDAFRNDILAQARAGLSQADDEWESAARHPRDEGDVFRSASMEHTIEWWVIWLDLEDQMPNEPLIVHRAVIWQAVYDEEYCVDMMWWGVPALKPSRWKELQAVGLTELSIEYFGARPETPEVPNVLLKLRQRANHSNFGSCPDCDTSKAAWKELRKDRKQYSLAELKSKEG
jgi:hypothetical protein